MTRAFRAALATACALAVVAPTQAPAKGFDYGVNAGEITATTAILWTRAPERGPLRVQWGRDKRDLDHAASVVAYTGRDLTVRRHITRLRPNTRYYYRFRQGSFRSVLGGFRTAPSPRANQTIRFAWSGDADATPAQTGSGPYFNSFQVYGRMANAGNHFNVNLGDTIYSDSSLGTPPVAALTLAEKWAKYRRNLLQANLQKLRAAAGLYSHWDDHEFINDFTRAEHGSIFDSGARAFQDYAPVRYTENYGLYRTFRWGRNLEVFLLDERTFRSLKATVNHVCDNPQTGQPDLAPTAPQSKRQLFSVLVPSLAEPVSPQCLAAINDPSRTMLGQRQYDRFTRAIKASTATFKVILNEVPIQQAYALPYDRWEGYEAERDRLLTYLRDNVPNTVFLSGDVHANWVNEARMQTFEEGGVQGSGIIEATTGPVATFTQAKEVDRITGREGSGQLIARAFWKPPPPDGVGMACSANDSYSYGQVTVTATKLTIRLLDLNGKPVIDANGSPCATITINKK